MRKRVGDTFLNIFAWGSALVLCTVVLGMLGFLFFNGAKALNLDLIFAGTRPLDAILLKRQVFDGLFPAIAGTLSLVFLSILFAVPLGVATGIFLSEFARGRIKKIFSLCFDILAGIPSIVIGLFGFSLTIFLHQVFSSRIYPCLLISALALSFLVLPYLIRSTQVALESLPLNLRLTALSLGASKLENIFFVLLPAAVSDIFSGIVLAIGRCAEDTAVIMLTGVVATAGIPKSIMAGYEALPFFIYYTAAEYADASELLKGYGAAIILLLICAGLFILSRLIEAGLSKKIQYSI